MRSYSVRAWLTQGTYPRLFAPILGIILAVTMVRYHLMLATELEEAMQHQRAQTQVTSRYLLPWLTHGSTNETPTQLQSRLSSELAFNPEIQSLTWLFHGQTIAVKTTESPRAEVPNWFASLVALRPLRQDFSDTLPDGTPVNLAIEVSNKAELERIWTLVGAQLRITALNIFTILFLLSLLLRANARMLTRLNTATDRFRSGHLNTRMVEQGTLEMRAVAEAFNGMAGQIQHLVKSQQTTQNNLAEQLHFTQQLVDALPLPVFVRGSDGTCLRVNHAWEEFFQLQANSVVGSPFPSDFVALPNAETLKSRRAQVRQDREILVKVGPHDVREIAYFKADFTRVDQSKGGTIGALVDITGRKLAEEALLEEKERAVVTLSSIADGVIATDLQGRVTSMNQAAQFLTGFSQAQAHGRLLSDVFQRDPLSQALPRGLDIAQLHLTDTAVQAVNQLLQHRSGERYAIEFTAAPIRKTDGSALGCVLVFHDVTETRELQQKISWQARHDPLTGLNNRDALSERLTHAIYQARQSNQMLGVCLLDLDHFQKINDQHGDWIGNRLLKEVALRLQGFLDDSMDASRLGGDEFVVLLQGQTDVDRLQHTVKALLERLAQPYAIDGVSIHSTASAGLAVFPQDDASPDILLRHADQAMYQAKQKGRGGLHVFDAQQDHEVQTHFTRLTGLAQALRGSEFRLYYQPKVNMRTGDIVGAEALLRWQHPERGLVGPAEFLPLMEHTDLIVETGEWVLHQALHQLQTWVQHGQAWVVSVNIAARHFHRIDFVDRLSFPPLPLSPFLPFLSPFFPTPPFPPLLSLFKEILSQYPKAPTHQLELEILESAALQDITHMREVMQGCQALGVCFALDDFGTGFSSLSYLKRLPAETIKIDRMFVDGLLEDADDATLVGAIVALSNAFGRTVIAEGVETPAQADKLLELGCELGQGYGIARPMPPVDMLPWASGFSASHYVRASNNARSR
ncbi:MAG: EAL domain-containing protein [Rhodoferax sp.]|nr:EAL domain-containing protein [Rhodoferax sp.]